MKKTVLLIVIIITLLFCNIIGVFADSISYDMEPADYYVYVATPDGGLNMRSGPGEEYNKVIEGRIPDGTRLYIEMISGHWGYTSYDGTYGWVTLRQTSSTPPQKKDPSPVPEKTPETTPDISTDTTTDIEETKPQEPSTPSVQTPISGPLNNESAGYSMLSQIILAFVIVILVIIIAVLIIVIVNMKLKK